MTGYQHLKNRLFGESSFSVGNQNGEGNFGFYTAVKFHIETKLEMVCVFQRQIFELDRLVGNLVMVVRDDAWLQTIQYVSTNQLQPGVVLGSAVEPVLAMISTVFQRAAA